jgi:hypothetical protein
VRACRASYLFGNVKTPHDWQSKYARFEEQQRKQCNIIRLGSSLINQAAIKAMVVIPPNATCVSLALLDRLCCSGCERSKDRHVRTADRIRDYLIMTVATPHSRIGNDRRSKRRRMEPIAEQTNDGIADAENIHPNINNHPIDHYSDEDDDGDTTTDSTSEAINEDISIVGQRQK